MTTTTHIAVPRPFLVMQDLVTLHARCEQTGGGFFAMEVEVAPGGGPPPLHDVLVNELRTLGIQARFQDSAHLSTTIGMVAAGHGLTLSAPPWLDGVAGIVWRPLTDVEIEIRTAAAWRAANRSPLLRALVDLLPAPADADAALPPESGRRPATPR